MFEVWLQVLELHSQRPPVSSQSQQVFKEGQSAEFDKIRFSNGIIFAYARSSNSKIKSEYFIDILILK
tara:strand:+ start:739 stop:942 length:204 start_codon:yes stop_codon:yes gene_type:complete